MNHRPVYRYHFVGMRRYSACCFDLRLPDFIRDEELGMGCRPAASCHHRPHRVSRRARAWPSQEQVAASAIFVQRDRRRTSFDMSKMWRVAIFYCFPYFINEA